MQHPVILDDNDENGEKPITFNVLELITNRVYDCYMYMLRKFPIEIQHYKKFLVFLNNYVSQKMIFLNFNTLIIKDLTVTDKIQ